MRRDGCGGARRRTARSARRSSSSQAELHARYGGVVPEIASRRHLELVSPVVREALDSAGVALDDVDRVAVTQGPGLIGALLVGLSAAKALAWSRRLPLVPVDHLQRARRVARARPEPGRAAFRLPAGERRAHAAARRPRASARQPERLGTTLDDAAGEAFDKGARLLGLGYPGGAEIDRLARDGDPERSRSRSRACRGSTSPSPVSRRRCSTPCGSSAGRRARASARRSRRLVPAGDRAGAGRPGARGGGADRDSTRSRSSAAWPRTRSSVRRSRMPRSRRSPTAPTTPR